MDTRVEMRAAFWTSLNFSEVTENIKTSRMHLVVKSSHGSIFKELPHLVEKASVTQREICLM